MTNPFDRIIGPCRHFVRIGQNPQVQLSFFHIIHNFPGTDGISEKGCSVTHSIPSRLRSQGKRDQYLRPAYQFGSGLTRARQVHGRLTEIISGLHIFTNSRVRAFKSYGDDSSSSNIINLLKTDLMESIFISELPPSALASMIYSGIGSDSCGPSIESFSLGGFLYLTTRSIPRSRPYKFASLLLASIKETGFPASQTNTFLSNKLFFASIKPCKMNSTALNTDRMHMVSKNSNSSSMRDRILREIKNPYNSRIV
jgi:hypothetical protein